MTLSTEKQTQTAAGSTRVVQTCDAIVVGGGLAGIIVSYLLAQYGYKTQLVEKSSELGALDRSFTNRNGRRFDFGLHVLDYMRSEFTTRLFQGVTGGRLHMLPRERGIVLGGYVIPYNVEVDRWPDALRRLFPDGELVDELGEEPPTRANLARTYGRAFTELILDEGLASYPSDHHHLSFGVPEEKLASMLYPWFFPRARRVRADLNESRIYQDRMREQEREYMLYPDEGGFGGFISAFREKLEQSGVRIRTGVDDLELDFDQAAGQVRHVRMQGELWSSPRVYWCAPAEILARLLGRPTTDSRPDRFMLGSFEFAQPVTCPFNELIVADPAQHINRINFPGKLARKANDLVQVEFAFPRGDALAERDEAFWRKSWLESLRSLGILQEGNRLLDFDLKTFLTCFNSYGIDGRPMPEVDLGELPPDSNLKPVLPTIRKVNINTRVPQYLEFLAHDLTRPRA